MHETEKDLKVTLERMNECMQGVLGEHNELALKKQRHTFQIKNQESRKGCVHWYCWLIN